MEPPVYAEYMVEKLGIPANQVEKLTQELYFQYGTTLAGLARSFSIDFDDWHKYVHGGIKQLLHRQPDTLKTLRDLNLQAHLLTNADALHVENCLTQLGLTDCFQVGAADTCSVTLVSPAVGNRPTHMLDSKLAGGIPLADRCLLDP